MLAILLSKEVLIYNLKLGEVSEWLMVPLSKSGLRYERSVGSNPTLSASLGIGEKGNYTRISLDDVFKRC